MRRALALALLLAAGCESGQAISARTQAATVVQKASFDGYVLPMNATALRAPENVIRLGGWNSDSSWTKLVHLADDGTEVAEGDVVARFEFRGDRARPYVDEQIRQAEAQRDQSGVETSRRVVDLSADEQKKRIDAERAELDTRKRGVIAERDWQLAVITQQQAEFDAAATAKNLKAAERERRAEAEYHERNVERAQSLDERFQVFKERFVVRAPHAGVLRHAFSRREGRKYQKGDGMPAGQDFASVARDKTIWVQFFVPERHYQTLQTAERFVVESATTKSSWGAHVDRIEEFPQELGFLKNDEKLPNAREKAYVVWAKFDEPPDKLSAGVEVRVRLP